MAWVSAARGMSCVCCAWPSNLKPRAVQSSSHGTSRAGLGAPLDRDPAADYRGPGCTTYFDAGRLATQVRECGIEVNYMGHVAQRYVFLFERARPGPAGTRRGDHSQPTSSNRTLLRCQCTLARRTAAYEQTSAVNTVTDSESDSELR